MSQLAPLLEQHIEHKGWSQTAAARALKAPQPTISKIVNGNIDKLSIEFLIELMVRAGQSFRRLVPRQKSFSHPGGSPTLAFELVS